MAASRLDVLVVTANAGSPWCAGLVTGAFTVRVTGCAKVALHTTLDGSPDVVVIDFTATGVDGLALARSLRDIPRRDNAPLLLVALNASGAGEDGRVSAEVDLSLPEGDQGTTAVLVSVLTRFRDFLADRRVCGGIRPTPSRSAIAAPPYRSRPLSN